MIRQRLNRRRIRRGGQGREGLETLVRPEVRLIHRRLLHVERQAEMDRTRPPGRHLAKRPAHHTRQRGGRPDQAVPFGQRAEQRLLIQLGQWKAPGGGRGDVRGDREDGHGAFARLDQPRRDIGRAAAGRPLANAGAPGDAGVGVGGVGGVAFIPHQDMGHRMILPGERVIEGQGRVAAKTEDMADAMPGQKLHHRLRARALIVGLCAHRPSLSSLRDGRADWAPGQYQPVAAAQAAMTRAAFSPVSAAEAPGR